MSKHFEVGTVCWFEIPVADLTKAKAFYGELFGWKFVPMSDDYLMIQVGEQMIGGLRNKMGSQVSVDSPVIYLVVEKIDDSIERARKLGAELIGKRTVISPDDGIYQWFRDLDGNLVSLWAKS